MSGSQGSACYPFKMVDGSTGRFLFIDKCNGTLYKFVNTGGLPNVHDGVPVEYLDTGVFYINYDCAKCHGSTRLRPMQVTMHFILSPCNDTHGNGLVELGSPQPKTTPMSSYHRETFIVTTSPITNPMSPEKSGKTNKEHMHSDQGKPKMTTLQLPGGPTELRFQFVDKRARECYDEVIATCSVSCAKTQLKELCLNSELLYSTYQHDHKLYKNAYCAICNTESTDGLMCGHTINDGNSDSSFGPKPPEISAFSLSVLFDFNGVAGISSISIICDKDQVLLPGGMTCGDIVCPSGYDLQNDKCVQLNPSQNHVWDFVYQLEINCSLSCELCKNNSIVSYNSTVLNITNQMAILVEEVKKNVSIISVEMSCTCGDVLMSNVTVKVDPPSGRHNIASNITSSLGREGTTIILNHLLNYLYAANSTVLFSRVTFYAFHSNHVSFELKYICPGYFVSDKDSAIEKTDLMLRGSEDNYHKDRYIRHNGSTFICYESHGPGLDDPISLALAALTIFLNILSFACICVRIVLQFTTKRYSSAANRMQFQLCLALGMSTGLLILTPLASPNAQVCFYFLLPLNISVI